MTPEQFGLLVDRHAFPIAVAVILLYHVLVVERRQIEAHEKLIGKIDVLIAIQHQLLAAMHSLAALIDRARRAG